MSMVQVYPKQVKVDGKDVQMFAPTQNGSPAIKGADVLKDNLSGLYYLTESMSADEKKALRAVNNEVNVCKSVQIALEKLMQATERASRIRMSEALSTTLATDIIKAASAFELACKPKPEKQAATKTKTLKYAHLFAR